jgi:hypothetical protein
LKPSRLGRNWRIAGFQNVPAKRDAKCGWERDRKLE